MKFWIGILLIFVIVITVSSAMYINKTSVLVKESPVVKAPGYDMAVDFADKYKSDLEHVCAYLDKYDYEFIYWNQGSPNKLEYSTGESSGTITVKDKTEKRVFSTLKQGGLKRIVKKSDNFAFVLWSAYDLSSGLVYGRNGKPDFQYDNMNAKLKKYGDSENWYCYRTER